MKMFNGNIAIPPGETIKDELEFIKMSQNEFSKRMGMSEKFVSQLINGEVSLTYDTALKLESVLGIQASFWNNLEVQYRETIARIEQEQEFEKEFEIAQKIPYKEMMKNEWINSTKEKKEIVRELKGYFGVADLSYLKNVNLVFPYYENLVATALYRKSQDKEICEYAMAAWIRKGEIEASKIETEDFNKETLEKSISEMRKLSKVNSKDSIIQLKELCRKAGIALVIVPQLAKTYVSGVSKWIDKNKALIILSNKGKKLDTFWFNFFHEIGHILKHKKKEIFINADETIELEIEKEANQFARSTLISSKDSINIKNELLTKENIIRYAEKIDIHPSIIVGRLQYDRMVPYHSPLINLKEDIIL